MMQKVVSFKESTNLYIGHQRQSKFDKSKTPSHLLQVTPIKERRSRKQRNSSMSITKKYT